MQGEGPAIQVHEMRDGVGLEQRLQTRRNERGGVDDRGRVEADRQDDADRVRRVAHERRQGRRDASGRYRALTWLMNWLKALPPCVPEKSLLQMAPTQSETTTPDNQSAPRQELVCYRQGT